MGDDFPKSVIAEVEQALDTDLLSIEPQVSGTHKRTYLIGDGANEWIIRVQRSCASGLKKALIAQQKARSVGVPVPEVIAYHVEARDAEEYTWIIEEYLRGSEFYPERFDRESRLATSSDIGRRLRLLHRIEVNGFGTGSRYRMI